MQKKKKSKDFGVMQMKPNSAISVTLKFVFGGILWILLSDFILNYFAAQITFISVSHLQVLKGLFFIGITGAVIFIVLHDYSMIAKAMSLELDGLFQANPLPMAQIDCESFRFVSANDHALKMFGYTLKEFNGLSLPDLIMPEDADRFQEVQLFIKTGFDNLGTWKFRTNTQEVFLAEISSTKIESRQIYLISFKDVTEQRKIQSELSLTNKNLQQQIAKRTDYLERANEELAYRASQTEHVNAELIMVNEKLLIINKKVAAEAEQFSEDHKQIREIFSALKEVVWSYNLSGGGKSYLSPGASELFETTEENLSKPWFWLEFIHHDDEDLKELYQRTVFEKGETFSVFRIITAKGNLRKLLIHTKIEKSPAGTTSLVGAFSDITHFPAGHIYPYLNIKTA